MKTETKKIQSVCVVGAGPAGSLTSYILSEAGFDVTIVDRYNEAKRKVCGEYLCPLGVSFIEEQGLGQLLEGFEPVLGMKIVSPAFSSVLSFFPKNGTVEQGYSLNRQSFDNRLRELVKSGRTRFIEGVSVTDIEKLDFGWSLKIGDKIESFDLLVAADGINSSIAQKLKHKKEINTSRVALHTYLKYKNKHAYSRLGQMHIFKDGSYAGINPINEEEINFSIVCDREKLKGRNRVDLINEYIKSSPELCHIFSELDQETPIKSAGSLKNRNSHIAGEQLAYVGDSAGFIDPLTGEGIFNALQSAYILGDSLKRFPNENGLLAYKKERESYFKEKNHLNSIFQLIIKSPLICELVARFLKVKQKRADTFIGIIGNVYTPIQGLLKLISN